MASSISISLCWFGNNAGLDYEIVIVDLYMSIQI